MTEEDSYYTITKPAEGLYKEKGSRFIGFAYPVTSENEIKEHLASLKKKYYDATHHCYAYILGPKKTNYKASDAGEPAHTAGDPIMNQIRSKNLTNVLVVVVRYFGGTKLGASGLTSAYKAAATEALSNAEVTEKTVTEPLMLRFPFAQMNEVMRLIKKANAVITFRQFTENDVHITVEVKKSLKAQLEKEIGKLY